MLKKIPIGIEDFKEIRTQSYYYIDKTEFIEDILNDGTKVKLFCRPRRFGKTLNMSTLKYFFSIENATLNKELFDDLYIKNSPFMAEQGKYPVIFITMKGLTGSSWNDILNEIKLKIKELFKDYRKISINLDKYDIQDFEKYILENDKLTEADLKKSLRFLTEILYKYYNQKVILLIDEYDSPVMTAYEKGYYSEMKDFLKAFYGDVLKTNEYLQMGVLTGIIRVAQAGIFSDLNNFKNYTIWEEKYSKYFGLTEDEVEKALEDYNIKYELKNIKEWYNGYNFGEIKVYNPWSILNYLSDKKLKAYWVNSSGNTLILNMLLLSDATVFDSLQKLINEEEVIVYINESIRMGDNLSPNYIWELMLFSGYLTVKQQLDSTTYLVKIPNKEVKDLFKALFVNAIFKGKNNIGDMIQALLSKNIPYIINILEEVVKNAMSYYDTSKKYENPYQTLLGGFFYGLDNYYLMYPNIETGYGRADIVLIPRNKNWAGYIFELKRAKNSDNDNSKEAEKAITQIENNEYDSILKREEIKEIIRIGLVFDGKKIISSYI